MLFFILSLAFHHSICMCTYTYWCSFPHVCCAHVKSSCTNVCCDTCGPLSLTHIAVYFFKQYTSTTTVLCDALRFITCNFVVFVVLAFSFFWNSFIDPIIADHFFLLLHICIFCSMFPNIFLSFFLVYFFVFHFCSMLLGRCLALLNKRLYQQRINTMHTYQEMKVER